MPTQPRGWVSVWAIAVLFGVATAVQVVRDARFPQFSPVASVLYVPSGEVMKRLTLSFDALAADVYWIRAVQHFGSTRRSSAPKRYELLYPLLDIATTLDPSFNIAYRFGSIFLAEDPPGGPGTPDLAIKLLEKGVAASPTRWQYLQDIGFVHYWWRHDYPAAAEWFSKASAVEGAPWWLASLSASTLAQGGDRQASRALWQTLRDSADEEWLRNDAVRRLAQLDALDQIEALSELVRTFGERGGARPFTWDGLVRAGLLRGIPVDPTGVPYYLGGYSGAVDLGDGSTLAPLPSEPPSARRAKS